MARMVVEESTDGAFIHRIIANYYMCLCVCVGLRERHCVWCRMCRICVCLRKSASSMSQLQLSSMNVHDNTQEHAGMCRGVQGRAGGRYTTLSSNFFRPYYKIWCGAKNFKLLN